MSLANIAHAKNKKGLKKGVKKKKNIRSKNTVRALIMEHYDGGYYIDMANKSGVEGEEIERVLEEQREQKQNTAPAMIAGAFRYVDR